MPQALSTIGLLYPGEMGAALARLLIGAGRRVVTCLDGRSAATAARSRAVGIVEVPTLEQLAGESNMIISVVSPGAAGAVAGEIGDVCSAITPGTIYLELNSISPERSILLARQIESWKMDFVDGAINGLAANLTNSATLFLSGNRAADVATVLGQACHAQVLSGDPGDASAMKMLLSGFSKGICALYIELASLAQRHELLPQLTETLSRIYPDIEALARRMVPTYWQHASRRAAEMHELKATAAAAGMAPPVISAVAKLHDALAAISFDAPIDSPEQLLSRVADALSIHAFGCSTHRAQGLGAPVVSKGNHHGQ
jgi:3-hydroxyisobutyrate dehydrogenase-like beta-hydroxyacid dehydrogenase